MMACALENCDPSTYANAQGSPEWENVMPVEIEFLLNNHTCDVVPWPPEKKIVKC